MITPDHHAALAALAAADALDGEPTRTELLLKALVHAVLADSTSAADLTPAEQLLVVMRREGGQWDTDRVMAAYKTAGIDGPTRLYSVREELKTLAAAGYLVRISPDRTKPVYEVAQHNTGTSSPVPAPSREQTPDAVLETDSTDASDPAAFRSPRHEQLLAIIRREGGQWDGQRALAACEEAGIALPDQGVGRSRHDLKQLAADGLLVQNSRGQRKTPVYELPESDAAL